MADNKFRKYIKKDGFNKFKEHLQAALHEEPLQDIEEEHNNKLKTESKKKASGILLSERHNYFTHLPPHIKADAMAVLNNPDYDEDFERQAMDLFKALGISPRIHKFPCEKTMEETVQIDTSSECDVVFANVASEVYEGVLSYFRDMLDYYYFC